MIVATSEPLTQPKNDKLRAWLNSEEARMLIEVVDGQVAALHAEAAAICEKNSVQMLAAQDVPPAVKDKLLAIANLNIFLLNFKHLAAEEIFHTVKLTVQ